MVVQHKTLLCASIACVLVLWVLWTVAEFRVLLADVFITTEGIAKPSLEGSVCQNAQQGALLLQTRGDSCDPVFPCGVLYNRVPKCGSSSVLQWMEERMKEVGADKCPPKFVHSTITKYRWLNSKDRGRFVKMWTSLLRSALVPTSTATARRACSTFRPTLFDRHMFWLDFRGALENRATEYDESSSPIYINVIRDPVDRCLSRYRYEVRLGRMPDISMKECIRTGSCAPLLATTAVTTVGGADRGRHKLRHRDGESSRDLVVEECSNYMTRWFCGMSDRCQEATRESLDIAKRRIREEYLYVGIFEDLKRSLALIQRLLPEFFGDRATWSVPHENKGSSDGHGVDSRHRDVDADVVEILRRANALDLELYDYAKQLHERRVAACL